MEDHTLRTLNESGFPLQVAIHRQVDVTTQLYGWKVLYSEHAWNSPAEARAGFLDLVIENRHGTSLMAIECKRPRDAEWVFLRSEGTAKRRAHVQAWISHYKNGSMPTFGWRQVTADPECPEMQFCAIRGQTTGDRVTLIERIAAELVLATESLAKEHKDYRPQRGEDLRLLYSVIVTTAQLKVATFDPSSISLQDGTLTNANFESVPFIRFRKQLGVHHKALTPDDYDSGIDVAYAKESTVFVVHAESLVKFLTEFELRSASLRQYCG
jgi:hypothetical protein